MAFITKSSIQDVKDRLDAIAVVGEYVRLEKKGGRWWGKCPFHAGGQERTPSFKVDPDLKMYHCFGCGKGDSVINFVMEMEKMTYPEAIKHLARKIGITLIYEEGDNNEKEPDNTRKDELYELYRRTTVTFRHFLCEKPEGKAALQYLHDRGISEEMINLFKLGFSPSNRNFLYDFLKKKGYSQEFLDKSGLFSSRYKTIPMFSGRLMFPISDRQSRVIAFGGRVMPGVLQNDGSEPPKYINSPETEIYRKSRTLYALDIAIPQIRKSKEVIIAEGYMDVIALHQAGITNAVAPLGTALTDEQVSLLHRWAEKAVLIFDEDEAGIKAAYKAIITCRKNALPCALVCTEDALKNETGTQYVKAVKDPADILVKHGKNVLKNIINCTINDFEYLINRGRSLFMAKGSGKNRAAEYLFPYLSALKSEIERDECITLIADSLAIDRISVQKDYSAWLNLNTGVSRQNNINNSGNAGLKPAQQIRMNNELFLMTVAAVNMKLYPELRTALEIKEINDPFAKELFIAMEECYVHDENDINFLLGRITDETLKNFIVKRITSDEFKGGSENENADVSRKLMEDGIKEIRKKHLYERIKEINFEIRKCEKNSGGAPDDPSLIDELLSEKKFLDSQLRKLSR